MTLRPKLKAAITRKDFRDKIAEMAKNVIRTGREVSGRRDIRCTVSIGGQ